MTTIKVWAGDNAIWRRARKAWLCDGNGARQFAPDCQRQIPAGTHYVEYVGQSRPFAHGTAHCAACAVLFGFAAPRAASGGEG